jgi:hypothetical protein
LASTPDPVTSGQLKDYVRQASLTTAISRNNLEYRNILKSFYPISTGFLHLPPPKGNVNRRQYIQHTVGSAGNLLGTGCAHGKTQWKLLFLYLL